MRDARTLAVTFLVWIATSLAWIGPAKAGNLAHEEAEAIFQQAICRGGTAAVAVVLLGMGEIPAYIGQELTGLRNMLPQGERVATVIWQCVLEDGGWFQADTLFYDEQIGWFLFFAITPGGPEAELVIITASGRKSLP